MSSWGAVAGEAGPTRTSSRAQSVGQWWVLSAIVAAGAYLRLAELGALGFRWDEDLSGLAVRAILEHGIPELPSGMIYLRGGIFSYLMAASAWLFGFNEFALRLPSALFGVALIVVAYLFAAALFGRRVGLITAGLVAISPWDIDLSRYARFYTAFSTFYLLTLYAIWRYRVVETSTRGGVLCVLLAIAALSLHDLAYSLAIAFFVPLALRGPGAWRNPREWLWPLGASAALAASYLAWREFVLTLRTLPAADSVAGEIVEQSSELRRSFLVLPDLPLLSATLTNSSWFVLLLAVAALAAALFVTHRLRCSLLDRIALLAIAGCAAAELFNFALLGTLLLAFSRRTGLHAWRSPVVLAAVGITAAAFVIWTIALLAGAHEPSALEPMGARTIVRELLDYPYFYVFWGFPNEWPLAAAVASVGALVAFERASRGTHGPAAGFALLALAIPLVGNGLFPAPFEIFRYDAAFAALFFVFVALAFAHWEELLPTQIARRVALQPAAALGTALLVATTLAYDLNPVRGVLAVARQYSNPGPLYRAFGIERYTDFKTTAEYVALHARPQDLIVTPDSREYYNYLGRVDVWLRSSEFADQSYATDGVLRDLYVNTPLVATLDGLKSALGQPGTAWVLASSRDLRDPAVPVAAEIRAFLRESESHVVYVGRDGDRKVYRFE